jgi:hypothetical protein
MVVSLQAQSNPSNPVPVVNPSNETAVQVVDSLQGLGPVRCAIIADIPAQAGWVGPPPQNSPQQLLACSGFGRSGALAVVRRGILPEAITEVPLPGERTLKYT